MANSYKDLVEFHKREKLTLEGNLPTFGSGNFTYEKNLDSVSGAPSHVTHVPWGQIESFCSQLPMYWNFRSPSALSAASWEPAAVHNCLPMESYQN
jgi:hypothetical protein